jgi:hypothetical protein
MKSKLSLLFASALMLAIASGTALAHHGTPAYSSTMTELKNGTVTKVLWSNPHTLINFDVKDKNGKVVHWVAETAAPQALRLIGWTKTSITPGDVITVYIFASKNGNPVGRLNHIVLADGTELQDTVLGEDRHPN